MSFRKRLNSFYGFGDIFYAAGVGASDKPRAHFAEGVSGNAGDLFFLKELEAERLRVHSRIFNAREGVKRTERLMRGKTGFAKAVHNHAAAAVILGDHLSYVREIAFKTAFELYREKKNK